MYCVTHEWNLKMSATDACVQCPFSLCSFATHTDLWVFFLLPRRCCVRKYESVFVVASLSILRLRRRRRCCRCCCSVFFLRRGGDSAIYVWVFKFACMCASIREVTKATTKVSEWRNVSVFVSVVRWFLYLCVCVFSNESRPKMSRSRKWKWENIGKTLQQNLPVLDAWCELKRRN